MTIEPEMLMAYADGELAGERRALLAAALQHDTGLQARVKAFEAQRQRVTAAFAEVLDEPVPDRLAAMLAAPPAAPASAPVVDLAERRVRRETRAPGFGWAQWGGMAACLCLGIALGLRIAGPSAGDVAGAFVRDTGGRMLASGPLERALSAGLASEGVRDGVALRLSFVARDGQYCRAFSTDRLAGLACRDAGGWAIETAVAVPPTVESGMRQATSPLPRAVLDLVDARIAGTTLSADEERAARERGWMRP